MSLSEYLINLRQVIEKIENYGFAELIDMRQEIRAGKQAVINIHIVLVDGSSLFIKEYVDAKYKIEKVSYAYQYQDREGKLIFRYDNAKHKPALQFHGHKHTSDGDVIVARPPDLSDLVDEVLGCL